MDPSTTPPPPPPLTPKSQNDRDEELRAYKEYEDIASTLPRKFIGSFALSKYQNFFYPSHLVSTTIAIQSTFRPRPSDVILATRPKSGTTWLKSIIFCIVNRARFALDDDHHPLLHASPHDLFPFLHSLYEDRTLPIDLLASMPSPRLLATHNPLSSLPASVVDSGCRIVHLCRDPKDIVVSMWHYMGQTMPSTTKTLPFDEFFELFSEGIVVYGLWSDHVLEYWEESLRRPEKVLFLKYEDMMDNNGANVRKLADFLDMAFTEEEEKEGVVEEIVRFCSFEKMRSITVNKEGKDGKSSCHTFRNSAFFRKGKVGDWKEHMSQEMARRLDDIVEKKLHDSGLTFRK
ncbi:flavonol 3-sulfotransferase-like [Typha angustifolia]|uniref:flavonol 3-sulfotransferase-like n=1 Tax=Typha angustifolia TaxID=59011 RepID=UPI003C2FB120